MVTSAWFLSSLVATSSSVIPGHITWGLMYSWLTQSRPWSELLEPTGSGMKPMKSQL